ncbi:DNA polymerase eta isoform X3 [Silene latifolia]|uniref:DNA polymerase eta isoform X3 n=1 Tax=Silene latifolia TaxID=37657 RepID=UPI003D781A98
MPVAKGASSNARVIAHVDMDCFYVQVEQRKQPQLRGLPTAVVQYNEWKGGGLIAVSYEARKHGVKRSMRGDEAINACPEIQLVQVPVARGKADLSIYRNAGSEVISILARKGRCERASIDEVYLDLTEAAEFMLAESPPKSMEDIDEEAIKSHILGIDEAGDNGKENVIRWLKSSDAEHHDKLLSCGAIIVAELRRQVLIETEFTCSAGIAHNKMLAKLASGLNKPAQQTIVPTAAVKDFLGPWPIKKMKQLGGKLGDSLQNDLGIKTVGELLQFSEQKLQERYGFNTGTWLWNIARGISGEEVMARILPKSHGSGKTFPGPRALRSIETVAHWLNQLCEELSERLLLDLEQNKRIANTITLHVSAFKLSDTDSLRKFPSKSCPLRYGVLKIQEDVLRLFNVGLREFIGVNGVKDEKNRNSGWGVTGLSISASKIIAVPQGTCSIRKFFASQQTVCATSSEGTPDDPLHETLHLPENKDEDQILDSDQYVEGRTCLKEQKKTGQITNFFHEQATSSSLLDQGTATGTPDIMKQGKSQFKHPSDEAGSFPSNSCTIHDRETKESKCKGTSTILRYLTKPGDSCSQLKRDKRGTIQDICASTASGNSEGGTYISGDKRWSYNVHEIDQTIIEELPPDIQEELRGWMQPLKQAKHHISGKGKSITSYFSLSKPSN